MQIDAEEYVIVTSRNNYNFMIKNIKITLKEHVFHEKST